MQYLCIQIHVIWKLSLCYKSSVHFVRGMFHLLIIHISFHMYHKFHYSYSCEWDLWNICVSMYISENNVYAFYFNAFCKHVGRDIFVFISYVHNSKSVRMSLTNFCSTILVNGVLHVYHILIISVIVFWLLDIGYAAQCSNSVLCREGDFGCTLCKEYIMI